MPPADDDHYRPLGVMVDGLLVVCRRCGCVVENSEATRRQHEWALHMTSSQRVHAALHPAASRG